MLFAQEKPSFVDLSIFVLHHSFGCSYFVVRKLALILPIIGRVFPFAMFLSPEVLSLIHCHPTRFGPGLLPLPIWKIPLPLPFIPIAHLFKAKCPLPLCLLFEQLSLVVPALRTDEPPLSVRHSFHKRPYITTAVGVDQFSTAMGQPVLPLTIGIIDKSNIVYSVRRGVFGANGDLASGTIGKRFEVCLHLPHVVMRAWDQINGREVSNELILLFDALVAGGKVGLQRFLVFPVLYSAVVVDPTVHLLIGAALLTHSNYVIDFKWFSL